MGTGKKKIIPKVMRGKTMKEIGQESSYLVRMKLRNRERKNQLECGSQHRPKRKQRGEWSNGNLQ